MKARDLAKVLLDHPDLDVVVRLESVDGETRTLPIRGACRAPLTERILLDVPDPADQEQGGQMLLSAAAPEGGIP